MPSSWLEDDEYEAWSAEADASDTQPRLSNDTANLRSATLPRQYEFSTLTSQQLDRDQARPRYAGSYNPQAGFQYGANTDVRTLQPPQYDINDDQLTNTSLEYSPKVSDSPAMPDSADGQSRPSDIDSLFGDSASEAGVENAQTQIQKFPPRNAGSRRSLLSNPFDEQQWSEDSIPFEYNRQSQEGSECQGNQRQQARAENQKHDEHQKAQAQPVQAEDQDRAEEQPQPEEDNPSAELGHPESPIRP